LACIARGIHILVEKPIASSVEEGRDIVAAARRVGVTLMVGHVERFNPAVAAIKQAISGEDILSIAITRVGPFPPRMSNVGVVIATRCLARPAWPAAASTPRKGPRRVVG